MTKLKVLVVYPGRFGFHVVSYFLCKYGSKTHDFSYLGLSFGQAEKSESSNELPNVAVFERNCQPGVFGRRALLRLIKEQVIEGGYDVVFTAYIPGVSSLKRFFKKRNVQAIVDVRSGFLHNNSIKRTLLNRMLRFECRRFDNITVNSLLLAKYLGFADGEVTELPLGAEPLDDVQRNYDKLRLIYVGSLSKRNVEQTVLGLKQYIDRFGKESVERFDIIGAGGAAEEQNIREAIRRSNLDGTVILHGYVPRERVAAFLLEANVGISFVPITPYYDMQPVTKTYEFLVAGLPVIATRTTQNKRLINDTNGILIDDSAQSFSFGLAEFQSKLNDIQPELIQESSKGFRWGNVMSDKYIPFIESIARSSEDV